MICASVVAFIIVRTFQVPNRVRVRVPKVVNVKSGPVLFLVDVSFVVFVSVERETTTLLPSLVVAYTLRVQTRISRPDLAFLHRMDQMHLITVARLDYSIGPRGKDP